MATLSSITNLLGLRSAVALNTAIKDGRFSAPAIPLQILLVTAKNGSDDEGMARRLLLSSSTRLEMIPSVRHKCMCCCRLSLLWWRLSRCRILDRCETRGSSSTAVVFLVVFWVLRGASGAELADHPLNPLSIASDLRSLHSFASVS